MSTTGQPPAAAPEVPAVDAIVVGAGPAGSCAAIALARAGHRVVLLERGPFPGSKNMYGGVVYPRILDELVPRWWEEAPVQRWVTRRSTMILTDTQAMTVDYRTAAWGAPPYNGATAYRPDFDHWLASVAEREGAIVVPSTTVTGLLRDARGAVIGVRTDRPNGDLHAKVVIACDGVNSFLAKEAGLYGEVDASNYTLGVKETIALPKEVIDERFGVRDREGVDIEILGGTGGVNGGGFVYTNLDTLAVGVVLKLPALAAQQRRPEEIIAGLKAHPAIAPLVEGGEVKEYSAHVIPEAGWKMLPKLTTDGMLVAGDAAALCLAAGIWLEGVNFAMASGMYAGEAAAAAIGRGDVSARGLAGYRARLDETFVLRDHRKMRRMPGLVLSDRVQHQYPALVTNVVERMFQVDNPTPKPGLRRILRDERRRAGVRVRDLVRDGWAGLRSLG
jgi:electron transfer flavoprotein-quinone oxidoreductase